MATTLQLLVITVGLARSIYGQYFPPKPEGLTTVDSKIHKGVKLSYKEVPGQYLSCLC